MNHIRHALDLPEWFELENYADASNLDVAGWHDQLFVRKMLVLLCTPGERFFFQGVIDDIRSNPIVDSDKDADFRAMFKNHALDDATSGTPQHAFGVSVQTVRSLSAMRDALTEERKKQLSDWRHALDTAFDERADFDYIHSTHKEWIDQPVSQSVDRGALLYEEAFTVN